MLEPLDSDRDMNWASSLEEMLGNSFLWERGWAELGVSVQFGSWSPWCRGRKEHRAPELWAMGVSWKTPWACLGFGVGLAQTFSELFAKLGSVSSSSNSADGSSSPPREPMWWFTLPNPFLAPNTPGSVCCGYSGQFTVVLLFKCIFKSSPSLWFTHLYLFPCPSSISHFRGPAAL